jgi:hypothetical protein
VHYATLAVEAPVSRCSALGELSTNAKKATVSVLYWYEKFRNKIFGKPLCVIYLLVPQWGDRETPTLWVHYAALAVEAPVSRCSALGELSTNAKKATVSVLYWYEKFRNKIFGKPLCVIYLLVPQWGDTQETRTRKRTSTAPYRALYRGVCRKM